ncbi:hypothetical protein [Bacillus sp. CRN 9]|uniref:hypothetical protein n=1 Tax=Cytobacillus horneckiae TaxID=549687 RepID=UPI0015629B4B|nr:hypothetical protein [Bacillus sp. CRN 9]
MGQITKPYRFTPHQDLHHKAAFFQSELEQMGNLSQSLLTAIKKELDASAGKVIEETMQTLISQHQRMDSIVNDQMSTMDTLAARYHYQVNDMNSQFITIHYEESEVPIEN